MENAPVEPKPKKTLRNVLVAVFMLAIAAAGFYAWNLFYKPNVPATLENEFVQFPTGSTVEDMTRILKEGNFILDEGSFLMMAERMNLKGRGGRFKIKPGTFSKLKRTRRTRRTSRISALYVSICQR